MIDYSEGTRTPRFPVVAPGIKSDVFLTWHVSAQDIVEDALWNQAPETCVILLTSVTRINLIKRKKTPEFDGMLALCPERLRTHPSAGWDGGNGLTQHPRAHGPARKQEEGPNPALGRVWLWFLRLS